MHVLEYIWRVIVLHFRSIVYNDDKSAETVKIIICIAFTMIMHRLKVPLAPPLDTIYFVANTIYPTTAERLKQSVSLPVY